MRDYHPVAVLLDLGLPFRAGSSLRTELKADPSTARIPVLIMSGIPESLTEERGAMAAAGLTKPFEITALLDALPTASAPGRRN